MVQFLVMALPIALAWSAITGRFTLDSLLLGFIIGVASLALLDKMGIRFGKLRSLDQPVAILIYTGMVVWNAFTSSMKVVKLVLSPKIELRTGIVALNSGDLSESQLLTGLSAHGINTTPGQMVIDIADGGVLYIHCLDLEASQPMIEPEQAKRLRLLRRIIGEREDE